MPYRPSLDQVSIRLAIRAYMDRVPGASHREVAALFSTSPSLVSDAMTRTVEQWGDALVLARAWQAPRRHGPPPASRPDACPVMMVDEEDDEGEGNDDEMLDVDTDPPPDWDPPDIWPVY